AGRAAPDLASRVPATTPSETVSTFARSVVTLHPRLRCGRNASYGPERGSDDSRVISGPALAVVNGHARDTAMAAAWMLSAPASARLCWPTRAYAHPVTGQYPTVSVPAANMSVDAGWSQRGWEAS